MNFIEQIQRKQQKINRNNLRKEINQKWVETKIINFLQKHSLKMSIDEVKDIIINDNTAIGDFFASVFAKDASRQNLGEGAIANIIAQIKGIENFQNLPSSNNLYLKNGEIQKLDTKPIGLKNIDFMFTYKNYTCVCTQKYTKAKGGAQDNQYNDVLSFLNEANQIKRDDLIAIIIVDGEYYSKDKMENLKSVCINSNVIICSGLDLEEELHAKI